MALTKTTPIWGGGTSWVPDLPDDFDIWEYNPPPPGGPTGWGGVSTAGSGSGSGSSSGSSSSSPWDPMSDPTYREIASLYAAMEQSQRLAMESGIARMRGYYGSESDPMSLFGRLRHGFDIRQRDIPNSLAARRMFRSGETGYQLNESRARYLQEQLDMRMKLEDYINGLLSSYAQSQSQHQIDLIKLAWELAQAQAASGTKPPEPAPPPIPPHVPPTGFTQPPPVDSGYVPGQNPVPGVTAVPRY